MLHTKLKEVKYNHKLVHQKKCYKINGLYIKDKTITLKSVTLEKTLNNINILFKLLS